MLTLVKDNPAVTIRGLTKKFGNLTALDNIYAEIPGGRIIGLLGENGSGKTTLLKVLAGLYADYDGDVEIDGSRPSHITKAKVSYLPDKVRFTNEKTPEEVVRFYRTYFDDFSEEKCRTLLKRFGIAPEKPFKEMSKGMVEKMQLSLVMSRRARLYLLDEPLGGVDGNARETVMDSILDNFDSESTMIVVTHHIHDMERLFDNIIVLREGRIVGSGECEDLMERTGKPLEEIVRSMK